MFQAMTNDVENPKNAMTAFFKGRCHGRGLIIDRFGKIRTRIAVGMQGWWDGSLFCLDETFNYEDGKSERRQWKVKFFGANQLSASALGADSKISGHLNDREVIMNYTFPVPVSGRSIDLAFDDRMYRLDDETLFETVTMSKFGISIARLHLVFTRSGALDG